MKTRISTETINAIEAIVHCHILTNTEENDWLNQEKDLKNELIELNKFLKEVYFKTEEEFVEIEIKGSNPF